MAGETRTYWCSFVDEQTRKNAGVCVVDVPADIAALVKLSLPDTAQPGAEWVVAASKIAHVHGCNPGGDMLACQLTQDNNPFMDELPRNVLLSDEELMRFGRKTTQDELPTKCCFGGEPTRKHNAR